MSPKVLIATQGSSYKNELVAAVCDELKKKPVYIKVMDVGDLDTADAATWDKIIVINTVMMNRMNPHVDKFFDQGIDLEKVYLMITSGGADFICNLPVDGISGASRKSDIDRIVGVVQEWVNGAQLSDETHASAIIVPLED